MLNRLLCAAIACGLAGTPALAAVPSVTPPFAATTAAAVQVAAADPLLKQAQVALTRLKFDPGPADGVLGAKTAAALRAFQKSKGYAESGILDTATAQALGVKR